MFWKITEAHDMQIILLKCHYDQILDTHFFTFSNTKGLS